jgi:hypothetical protein
MTAQTVDFLAEYAPAGDGVQDTHAALVAANTLAAGALLTLRTPPTAYRVSTNTTLSAALDVQPGGFSNDSGVTLTLNGPLADPGPVQIFSGAGTVALGAGVEFARPEWWGGKADWNGTTGTDNGPAFAKALASGANRLVLLPGNYAIKTADANSNAITMLVAASRIVGSGRGLTTITFVGLTATWGIKATQQLCEVSDLTLAFSGAVTMTYGVGVTNAVSAQSCRFRRVYVQAGSQVLTAGFAIGPDVSSDIANTVLEQCQCASTAGAVTYGILAGNGTPGNVGENWANDCVMSGCQFGVCYNGGMLTWRGGGHADHTQADFLVLKTSISPFLIDGGRGENGNMVLQAGYVGASLPGATIVGYVADNYTPTRAGAGVMIEWNVPGALTLLGGSYRTTGGNTLFKVADSGAPGGSNAVSIIAIGVATDSANPYPGPLSYVQRVIIGAQQIISSTPTPLVAFANLVDGYSSSQGVRVSEATNGKQGTATLTAGTVTVANTSVTAVSRFFLTAQDNNTTGALRVSARTAGTSFVITSSNAGDTGVVAYEIFEPA